jgi:hypothetical protein
MNGCSLRLPPSFLRPLLQHARPLPHGEPDPRPVFDCRGGYLTGLVRIVAGVERALESACLGPLFDLVVVAMVGNQRLGGFFAGPVVIHAAWAVVGSQRMMGTAQAIGAECRHFSL